MQSISKNNAINPRDLFVENTINPRNLFCRNTIVPAIVMVTKRYIDTFLFCIRKSSENLSQSFGIMFFSLFLPQIKLQKKH